MKGEENNPRSPLVVAQTKSGQDCGDGEKWRFMGHSGSELTELGGHYLARSRVRRGEAAQPRVMAPGTSGCIMCVVPLYDLQLIDGVEQ